MYDGSLVVWNPLETDETKQKRVLPQKHSNGSRALSFSPDGRFLAAVDQSGETIIWSTEVRNRGGNVYWTCAVRCCRFTNNGLSNRRTGIIFLCTFLYSFLRFSFLIRLGGIFAHSPVQMALFGLIISRGCNPTRRVTLSLTN